MHHISKILGYIEKISLKVATHIIILVTFCISILNLIFTTYFDSVTYKEHCLYKYDNVFVTIVLTIVFIFGLIYFIKKINLSEVSLINILIIYTAILGVTWISIADSYPVADSSCIFNIASEFLHGNYNNFFDEKSYLAAYPYQLGMIFFIELIYKVVGEGVYFFPMILNVVCMCTIFYFLYKITKEVFNEIMTSTITIILLFGCFPAILYCTYIYGTIYGLTFAVIGIYALICYYNSDKIRYIIMSAMSIGISIIFKSNYSIVLVAAIIMLIFKFCNVNKITTIIFMILVLVIPVLLNTLLCTYYEERSGGEIKKGAPKSLWIAMGLQEGDVAEGWYNGFNWLTFLENPNNQDSDKIAKESIKESIEHFKNNPKYAINFFSKKIISQWAEPTYQSLFSSHYLKQHARELSDVGKSIYEGYLNKVLLYYMNIYNFIIWVCSFFFFIINRKKITPQQLFCGIIIIGGFLFHIMWEGKSMYIFPYFMLAIPYCSAGISSIAYLLKKK